MSWSFNPRSREGSDFGINWSGSWIGTGFNPRSREGSDVWKGIQRLVPRRVSIHAPAKGATLPGLNVRESIYSFNPRSREGSDGTGADYQVWGYQVSIHAPAKGATAISAKNSFYFSAEINKLSFYILNFPLFPSPLFLHSTSFVHILECESPGIFMSASYSHSYIITKSMYHLLQFRDRHPYVPPLSDTYFPDNRTSGCQRSHQLYLPILPSE